VWTVFIWVKIGARDIICKYATISSGSIRYRELFSQLIDF